MSNFIVDLFRNVDKDNKKLTEYLTVQCRRYNVKKAQKISDYYLHILTEIYGIFESGTTIALLNTADGVMSHAIRQWLMVIYAIRYEMSTTYISYSQFVGAVKNHEDDLIESLTKAPFLILEYPELVSNADWARGKLMDVIRDKKNMLIVTSNFDRAKKVFGDVVASTVNSIGVAIVNTEMR